MKKILIFTIAISALGMYSFTIQTESVVKTNSEVNSFDIPENIEVILDKSCMMCHNTASKNMKGKTKLNFDKLKEGYKPHKKVAKLMEIVEEVKESSMPPKKFNAKHPEKRLTEEERTMLYEWAEAEAKKLSE